MPRRRGRGARRARRTRSRSAAACRLALVPVAPQARVATARGGRPAHTGPHRRAPPPRGHASTFGPRCPRPRRAPAAPTRPAARAAAPRCSRTSRTRPKWISASPCGSRSSIASRVRCQASTSMSGGGETGSAVAPAAAGRPQRRPRAACPRRRGSRRGARRGPGSGSSRGRARARRRRARSPRARARARPRACRSCRRRAGARSARAGSGRRGAAPRPPRRAPGGPGSRARAGPTRPRGRGGCARAAGAAGRAISSPRSASRALERVEAARGAAVEERGPVLGVEQVDADDALGRAVEEVERAVHRRIVRTGREPARLPARPALSVRRPGDRAAARRARLQRRAGSRTRAATPSPTGRHGNPSPPPVAGAVAGRPSRVERALQQHVRVEPAAERPLGHPEALARRHVRHRVGLGIRVDVLDDPARARSRGPARGRSRCSAGRGRPAAAAGAEHPAAGRTRPGSTRRTGRGRRAACPRRPRPRP